MLWLSPVRLIYKSPTAATLRGLALLCVHQPEWCTTNRTKTLASGRQTRPSRMHTESRGYSAINSPNRWTISSTLASSVWPGTMYVHNSRDWLGFFWPCQFPALGRFCVLAMSMHTCVCVHLCVCVCEYQIFLWFLIGLVNVFRITSTQSAMLVFRTVAAVRFVIFFVLWRYGFCFKYFVWGN